jgi:hypothetical protein
MRIVRAFAAAIRAVLLAMINTARFEEHVSGRRRIAVLPQIVSMTVIRKQAAEAAQAADREAERRDMAEWILQDLMDDDEEADTVDAKRKAKYG